MKTFTSNIILIILLLELWVCTIELLKTKELYVLLSIVFFNVVLCLVCFLFVVWLFCFGYGMDEVMMY